MSGGKTKAPPAPDYSPIAAADAAAATQQYQLGQQQLDWGKQQFNAVWPYAQQYLQRENDANAENNQIAMNREGFYQSTYRPIEAEFAADAQNYDTAARREQDAGTAMADVSNAFEGQRRTLLSNLESYGIDPSQTRYGALDLGSRISQAAATAAAGTQARRNTEATGLSLLGEAINTGKGYPAAVAGAYSTATEAGRSGLNAANQTVSTGAGTMGTPTQYMQLGNQSSANRVGALNTGFSNAYDSARLNTSIAGNQAQGIGTLIGGGLGLAAALI